MAIKAIKGMIMDVAPLKSQAMAIWMRSGFNSSNAIWRFELKEKGVNVELIHPFEKNINKDIEPWLLPHETLWKITPELGKLKYIYIFPNPEDNKGVDDMEAINQMIYKCLDTLSNYSITSVSFILIPALQKGNNFETQDLESAKQMIISIQNWLYNMNQDMDVYLVDRVDGFKAALEPGDK